MNPQNDNGLRRRITEQLSRENLRQFLIYLLVGGLATLVELLIFYIEDRFTGMHYALSTVIAMFISTFSNWAFGRILLFKSSNKSFIAELSAVYAAAAVGFLLNLLFMWIGIDLLHLPNMLAKICATGLVFFWNFLIRKIVIYKN